MHNQVADTVDTSPFDLKECDTALTSANKEFV